VRVAQLVRREASPDARVNGKPAELNAVQRHHSASEHIGAARWSLLARGAANSNWGWRRGGSDAECCSA
jgi:hypothetical protein